MTETLVAVEPLEDEAELQVAGLVRRAKAAMTGPDGQQPASVHTLDAFE